MSKKKVQHVKRPLYAEIGRYFAPDGSFNERAFSKRLYESIEKLKKRSGGRKDLNEMTEKWLADYLISIMDYLDEKNMHDASLALFRASVRVSEKIGLKKISLPVDRITDLIEKAGAPPEAGSKKRERETGAKKMRDKIIKAALQVFAKEGFHKATMDSIAAISGVGKGSVYRYFKSKKDLIDQLLREKYDEITAGFSRIFSMNGDIIDQIAEALAYWIKFIEKNVEVYRFIQRDALESSAGGWAGFYDYLASNLPLLKERIISLNREKKLKTTKFYTVVYGALGFIDGVVHKWYRSGMNYPLTNETPVILEVLFNGFVGEKVSRKRFYKSE